YIIMFMNKTLRKHIVETDKQAKERFEMLMKQMLEKSPIDENLKNTDPLKWTGLMNNYKHSVEEVVLQELIFA
ncbi:MAG: TnpV protein, partial [Clostridia bacterium]|nr:TnpV protein [Clostridia bacterium]